MPKKKKYYENNSIDIYDENSQVSLFFRLPTPFQMTYEVCSGIRDEDYLNVVTLSENEPFYLRESMQEHNAFFNRRAAHFHDYYEFLLVLEGTLIHQIEGKNYLYPAGTCCLINRNILHKETFKSASKICFFGFSARFLAGLLHSADDAYFPQEQAIRASQLYQFIIDDLKDPGKKVYLDFLPTGDSVIKTLQKCENIKLLMNAMLYPKFGATYQINGALCDILSFLADKKNFHCTTVEVSNDSDHLLFQRISHLLEDEHGRLSRQDLSKRLNYSGDYINRIIHKYTGMCLHDYSMDFAVRKAADDLLATDDSIAEIGARLQFSNRTYFYQVFKNKYGMTPKQYRTLHRKEET